MISFKSFNFSGLGCNSFGGGFAFLDIYLDHLRRLPSATPFANVGLP